MKHIMTMCDEVTKAIKPLGLLGKLGVALYLLMGTEEGMNEEDALEFLGDLKEAIELRIERQENERLHVGR